MLKPIRVVGIKITKDHKTDTILYQKGNKHYIRTATDGFAKGKAARQSEEEYFNKWGFRRVTNLAEFYDGEDILANIGKFSASRGHKSVYNG